MLLLEDSTVVRAIEAWYAAFKPASRCLYAVQLRRANTANEAILRKSLEKAILLLLLEAEVEPRLDEVDDEAETSLLRRLRRIYAEKRACLIVCICVLERKRDENQSGFR